MKKWAIVDNTLTAIKNEIKRLRSLGYRVTEVTIWLGQIEYEDMSDPKEELIEQILALKPYAIKAGFDYPTQEITEDIPTEVLADFRVELIDHLVDTRR